VIRESGSLERVVVVAEPLLVLGRRAGVNPGCEQDLLWVARVLVGVPDSALPRDTSPAGLTVMLRPPKGGPGLELSSFVQPDHEPGSPTAMANELGLRNVAFEVDDLQATVDRLAADGYALVGGIGQYEHVAHGPRARARGDHRLPD
jgi:catechol 2,3-dioxygenase-like lactoylglutathione lyase family enzyme